MVGINENMGWINRTFLMKLLRLLAFTRIPGNAFSFWARRMFRCSRGKPTLRQEPKNDLFSYLKEGRGAAEARATELHDTYQLAPLAQLSTASLYRKNLYLLDILEKATDGLLVPSAEGRSISALDVGSKDWYYVFAQQRWLHRHNRNRSAPVKLTGIELDGSRILTGFHSCAEYAQAYVEQTGNPEVRYRSGDFLDSEEGDHDVIFIFYPLLLRSHVLLWGLPLRYFAPRNILLKAASLTRPGGWLIVFCHTLDEHSRLLEFGQAVEEYQLLREGRVESNLVDFRGEINDCRFSIWKTLEPNP